MLKLTIFFKT